MPVPALDEAPYFDLLDPHIWMAPACAGRHAMGRSRTRLEGLQVGEMWATVAAPIGQPPVFLRASAPMQSVLAAAFGCI